MRRGSLSAGDRDAPSAPLALLEDAAQPVHRALVLAPQPAARAEPLHEAVGRASTGSVSSVKRTRVAPAASGARS